MSARGQSNPISLEKASAGEFQSAFFSDFGYEIEATHIHLKHNFLNLFIFLFDFVMKGNKKERCFMLKLVKYKVCILFYWL